MQVPEARLALVTPYDKGAMAAIEKAIRDSDLGVNPGSDGTVIRVNFPQLTEERRKEFIKVAKGKAEDSKVAIRAYAPTPRHAERDVEACLSLRDEHGTQVPGYGWC